MSEWVSSIWIVFRDSLVRPPVADSFVTRTVDGADVVNPSLIAMVCVSLVS